MISDRRGATVAHDERLSRLFVLVLVAYMLYTATLTTTLLLGNSQRGKENHKLLKQVVAQGERIKSCTTHGHPCYDAGMKQQAGVVAGLDTSQRQAAAAASACAVKLAPILREMDPTAAYARVYTCQQKTLAKAQ